MMIRHPMSYRVKLSCSVTAERAFSKQYNNSKDRRKIWLCAVCLMISLNLKIFIITCTKIGMKLNSQHSTFELVLLVTADECWSNCHLYRFVLLLLYQKETPNVITIGNFRVKLL